MNWDTLPKLTANAPENGWLEYFLVSLFGVKGLFSGAHLLLVSGSSVIFQNASLDLLVKNAWEKWCFPTIIQPIKWSPILDNKNPH